MVKADLEELAINIPARNMQQPPVQWQQENEWMENEEGDDEEENEEGNNEEENEDGDDNEDGGDTDGETVLAANDTIATDDNTSHIPGHGMRSSPKLTKAEIRAQKKAAKLAKSQSKAAKNQQKHTVSVRSQDVAAVARILHGDNDADDQNAASHPLASDKTIEEVIARNVGFMASIEDHKRELLSSISQRRKSDRESRNRANAAAAAATVPSFGGKKKRKRFSDAGLHRRNATATDGGLEDEDDDELEDVVVAVLTKLGVKPAHLKAGNGESAKKKGATVTTTPTNALTTTPCPTLIVANLKAVVKDDLARHENDQREMCIRAGGFWRYVGRPVFERMTQIARELDWKTGMKLKEKPA
jgi:hypothetical protein